MRARGLPPSRPGTADRQRNGAAGRQSTVGTAGRSDDTFQIHLSLVSVTYRPRFNILAVGACL